MVDKVTPYVVHADQKLTDLLLLRSPWSRTILVINVKQTPWPTADADNLTLKYKGESKHRPQQIKTILTYTSIILTKNLQIRSNQELLDPMSSY